MILSHDDPRLSWQGQISLETTAEYTRPWRIPFVERGLYFPDLVTMAQKPSGVRLAMRTTTRKLAGSVLPFAENNPVDLLVDGVFFSRAELDGKEAFAFADLPSGEKRVELWLPHFGDFALRHLEVDDGATVAPYEDVRKRWVTHGSSLTQSVGADLPSDTWPAIVARERDLNLTNLGFGGQCHLDALVARIMRDTPADFLSICVGINIYGQDSLNVRTFPSSLIGFVRIVREKHPETPLALISPMYCAVRETTPNKVDLTLQDYRKMVADVVDLLRQEGDRHVSYIHGLDLGDESLARLMPDGLHPNGEGYRVVARNFLERAAPGLFGKG